VKIDENLPGSVADLFEEAGIDAETVLSEGMGGASDESLAEASRREDRVLVSLDTDFSNIRRYPPAESPGYIVLRPETQDIRSVLQLIDRLIPEVQESFGSGSLWIVEPERIRIREQS